MSTGVVCSDTGKRDKSRALAWKVEVTYNSLKANLGHSRFDLYEVRNVSWVMTVQIPTLINGWGLGP